jgi:hypothetical protein
MGNGYSAVALKIFRDLLFFIVIGLISAWPIFRSDSFPSCIQVANSNGLSNYSDCLWEFIERNRESITAWFTIPTCIQHNLVVVGNSESR